MGGAIAQVVALGVGVSISPLAVIAVTLMLGGRRGRLAAAVFVAAWAFALLLLGGAVLLLADEVSASEAGAPAGWVGVVKLLLAALLLVVAARQWRQRPSGGEAAQLPAWMESIEAFSPMKAASTAMLFAAVKPKNLLLTIGAATAIAETGAKGVDQLAALIAFAAIGTVGPVFPLVVYLVSGERAEQSLGAMRDWLVRENTTVIVVLCILIAAKLAGDAIGTLAA